MRNDITHIFKTHDAEVVGAGGNSTGLPLKVILELVKLSDLSRLRGVKGIRARLYYDAGFDTVEKLAGYDPENLRKELEDFVKRTNFNGIAPLPKEIVSTIEQAKKIKKIVEY